MTLARMIGTRILAGLVVLWGAATLTFFALHATAGDPAIAILGGPEALPTPAVLAQVRHDYGLDDPLPIQYVRYLGRLASGDLGESYRLHAPVATIIGEQAGATLLLAFLAAMASLLIAIPLALATAGRSRSVQHLVATTELVLIAVPNFIIGIGLLFLFAYVLHLLPVAGSKGWRSLVLPVLTLALPTGATLSQVLRGELERILEQPFITTARARGLSEALVRFRHALRHGLIPVLNLGGYIFGFLLGGAVITETLFARRGLGRLMVDSAMAADVPVVTGIALFAAATYVLVTLAVDVAASFADPRIAIA